MTRDVLRARGLRRAIYDGLAADAVRRALPLVPHQPRHRRRHLLGGAVAAVRDLTDGAAPGDLGPATGPAAGAARARAARTAATTPRSSCSGKAPAAPTSGRRRCARTASSASCRCFGDPDLPDELFLLDPTSSPVARDRELPLAVRRRGRPTRRAAISRLGLRPQGRPAPSTSQRPPSCCPQRRAPGEARPSRPTRPAAVVPAAAATTPGATTARARSACDVPISEMLAGGRADDQWTVLLRVEVGRLHRHRRGHPPGAQRLGRRRTGRYRWPTAAALHRPTGSFGRRCGLRVDRTAGVRADDVARGPTSAGRLTPDRRRLAAMLGSSATRPGGQRRPRRPGPRRPAFSVALPAAPEPAPGGGRDLARRGPARPGAAVDAGARRTASSPDPTAATAGRSRPTATAHLVVDESHRCGAPTRSSSTADGALEVQRPGHRRRGRRRSGCARGNKTSAYDGRAVPVCRRPVRGRAATLRHEVYRFGRGRCRSATTTSRARASPARSGEQRRGPARWCRRAVSAACPSPSPPTCTRAAVVRGPDGGVRLHPAAADRRGPRPLPAAPACGRPGPTPPASTAACWCAPTSGSSRPTTGSSVQHELRRRGSRPAGLLGGAGPLRRRARGRHPGHREHRGVVPAARLGAVLPRQHVPAGVPPEARGPGHHRDLPRLPVQADGAPPLGATAVLPGPDRLLRRARRASGTTWCRRRATPPRCWPRDFGYDGEVLEIGYPRNDVLQSRRGRRDPRRGAGVARDRGRSQTAVLYAPTFRDYLSPRRQPARDAGLLRLRAWPTAGSGDDYVDPGPRPRVQRAHRAPDQADRPGCIDVTDYPEVSDLYLAADAAVVDYSSLRFDFGVTGKPMIFHVPDLQRYQDTRGWLFDFEPTAPGPLGRHDRRGGGRLRRPRRGPRASTPRRTRRSPTTTSTSRTGTPARAVRGCGLRAPRATHERTRVGPSAPDDRRRLARCPAARSADRPRPGARAQRHQHDGRDPGDERLRRPRSDRGQRDSNPSGFFEPRWVGGLPPRAPHKAGVRTLDSDPGRPRRGSSATPAGPGVRGELRDVARRMAGRAPAPGDQGPAPGVVPRPLGGRRHRARASSRVRDDAASPLRGVVEPDGVLQPPRGARASPAGSTSR